MPERLVDIGKITRPHGLRGEVRVLPLTDFPERFKSLSGVIARREGPLPSERAGERRLKGLEERSLQEGKARDDASLFKLEVEGVKSQGNFVILKFRGVDSRTQAEQLRGLMLSLPEEELVPLPPGHYFVYKLIGLDVFSTEGERLGKVVEVIRTKANDVYVVQDGEREFSVPAVREFVKGIDLDGGRVVIEVRKGLR